MSRDDKDAAIANCYAKLVTAQSHLTAAQNSIFDIYLYNPLTHGLPETDQLEADIAKVAEQCELTVSLVRGRLGND